MHSSLLKHIKLIDLEKYNFSLYYFTPILYADNFLKNYQEEYREIVLNSNKKIYIGKRIAYSVENLSLALKEWLVKLSIENIKSDDIFEYFRTLNPKAKTDPSRLLQDEEVLSEIKIKDLERISRGFPEIY
jgi:hypothetical protein